MCAHPNARTNTCDHARADKFILKNYENKHKYVSFKHAINDIFHILFSIINLWKSALYPAYLNLADHVSSDSQLHEATASHVLLHWR